MDESAISKSSSSSAVLERGDVGFAGSVNLLAGGVPVFGLVGMRLGFVAGLVGVTGFRAVAVQPHAVQTPLKFKASPQSLHNGTG